MPFSINDCNDVEKSYLHHKDEMQINQNSFSFTMLLIGLYSYCIKNLQQNNPQGTSLIDEKLKLLNEIKEQVKRQKGPLLFCHPKYAKLLGITILNSQLSL